jgi:hypothetical protein
MSEQDNIDLWLQRHLRILSKDDLSPAFFSSSTIVGIGDRTRQRWQIAVDTIYRCIVSDLVRVLTPKYRDNRDEFFHAIRTLNPFDDNGVVLWNGVVLCSTDGLIALIDKYFPKTEGYDPRANPAFIEKLRAIFSENSVPWSDAPLLPIIARDPDQSETSPSAIR